MLYLEDCVEMIEHVPQDIIDRLTELREMDLGCQNTSDAITTRTSEFFGAMKKAKVEDPNAEYEGICAQYSKAVDISTEKVNIATQMEDMMQRHMKKMDAELTKFKWELEADHPGITEVLEERSRLLDASPTHTTTPSTSRASTTKGNRKSQAAASAEVPIPPGPLVRGGSIADGVFFSPPNGFPTPAAHGTTPLTRVYSPDQSFADSGIAFTPVAHAGKLNGRHPSALAASSATSFSNSKKNRPMSASASPVDLSQLPVSTPKGIPSKLDSVAAAAASSSSSHAKKHKPRKRPKSQGASLSSTLANLDVSNGHLPPHPSTTNSDPSLTAASLSHTQLQQQQMAAAAAAPLTANWNIVEPNLDPGEAEKLYCLCNQVSYGEMIACDNSTCSIEWFHYPCVNLQAEPEGKWYCPNCASTMNTNKRKKHHHRSTA